MLRTIEFHIEINGGFLEIYSSLHQDKRRYEWQYRENGEVLYKHEAGYGLKADALRDGLCALVGLPQEDRLLYMVKQLREAGVC